MRRLSPLLGLLLICSLLFIPSTSLSAAPHATITVNTVADTLDSNSDCSLREAITAANTNLPVDGCAAGAPGLDTIEFDIPGAGPHTIFIGPIGLPTITEPVFIDGYSEPGSAVNTSASTSNADIRIILNGSSATTNGIGLHFKPDVDSNPNGSTVRGLVIQMFPSDGIRIEDTNAVKILGNFIGTSFTGVVVGVERGNGGNGITIINGDNNEIGDRFDGVATRNLISDNEGHGILITGSGSTGNIIEQNLIGTDRLGTDDLGNTGDGIHIDGASGTAIGGSVGTTPGGACTGSCNLISGNGDASAVPAILSDGIQITGNVTSANFVQGNIIGLDVTGTAALGNSGEGVLIDRAANQQVGGTTAEARNVISGNGGDGVEIDNATIGATSPNNNLVSGNFIGTDTTGTLDFGNGSNGVAVLAGSGNRIGGTTGTTPLGACTGACNLLSGNAFDGISIAFSSTGTIVEGNFIGTQVNGTVGLGNTFEGININGPSNLNIIGGTTAAARNIISANGSDGVEIQGSTAVTNTIQGNFIGTDTTGEFDLGNADDGVFISGAPNNKVGGTSGTTPGGACTGACNVISGNDNNGVQIKFSGASGNVVLGNFIGTDKDGVTDRGNADDGVFINTASGTVALNLVGGTTAAARNVISGNNSDGVAIEGTGSITNTVSGNFIGTDTTGEVGLGNNGDGVDILNAPNNIIGGTTGTTPGGGCTGACNLISGNDDNGVIINGASASGNTILGNFIGTDDDGVQDIGNSDEGVLIQGAPSNTVGGATPNARNVISGNDSNGVRITQASATSNFVTGNYIGVQTDGATALGNSTDGVVIENGATLNQIGGTTGVTPGFRCAGACNVISTNGSDGVQLNSNSNIVLGNFIGTDVTGLLDRGNNFYGVFINNASNNTIGGTVSGSRNVISGNTNDGVFIQGASATNNAVVGNFIGTTTAGTAALQNDLNGVLIFGAGNTIGGTSGTTPGGACSGACNVISGNGSNGVSINGVTATGNTVAGNFIGTTVSGTADLGNSGNGVQITGAPNVTIGGASANARNIISGNDSVGINVNGNGTGGHQIIGNYIGTDTTGANPLGNTSHGVSLFDAPNSVIGGTAGGARNVISANGGNGVRLLGFSNGTSVQGNYIGVNATGTADLGNSGDGVFLFGTSNITLGGKAANAGNVISGNGSDGIEINSGAATNTTLQGNLIGTNAAGTGDLGNDGHGVFINGAPSNLVGGTASGAGNTIAFNDLDGVSVTGATATGNVILRNSISDNGELGIDLNNDGPTANDAGDPDPGANNLQNYPLLNVAVQNGTATTIRGTLNSLANTTFRLEFFDNTICDSSGFGEGKTFLGALEVTTDGAGNVAFVAPGLPNVPIGHVVTATATRLTGPGGTAIETSEFSPCRVVEGSAKPAVFRAGTWFLRNTLTGGPADIAFLFGAQTGDIPLMCDWDGDGDRTPGVFRNGTFFLRNSNSSGFADIVFSFGLPTDTPICGDWDGDGVETIGVTRDVSNIKTWFLRNSNTTGIADISFQFGLASDRPVVGDWDGNGVATIGVFRQATWFLRNDNSGGNPDLVFQFGAPPSDLPLVGDWDGDGIETIGVLRGNAWLLRNSNTGGFAEIIFQFGLATDTHLVWR